MSFKDFENFVISKFACLFFHAHLRAFAYMVHIQTGACMEFFKSYLFKIPGF